MRPLCHVYFNLFIAAGSASALVSGVFILIAAPEVYVLRAVEDGAF